MPKIYISDWPFQSPAELARRGSVTIAKFDDQRCLYCHKGWQSLDLLYFGK
jgi:hypothetical protein